MIAISAVVALSEHVAGWWRWLRRCLWRRCWRWCMCLHLLRDTAGRLLQPWTGMMLGTVGEAADVQVAVLVVMLVAVLVALQAAVQVAVSIAVQVGVVVDRRGDSGPSAGASVPCPDLLFGFCSFPTFDVAAGALPLSPFGLEEPLLAGRCSFSLQYVGTFFTLAGGGMACSVTHWQP
ncbi:hypothetical protein NDU88_002944 [Pleurodeles waltl]|uniref:Uncharacterized protein n=1 Tax=Pleurodeles waltl TaxID=8319 RepID=A0AAV7UXL6_PLEWA|nr:hypothetical protein NDU88_002944 [Pleurodeles waltl]